MRLGVFVGILMLITTNSFAVNQKQQYQVANGGSCPVVSSEWTVEVTVKDLGGNTTLHLTNFVTGKLYLQCVGTLLFLNFELSQYPAEVIVDYPIEVKLTWTDPATSVAYTRKRNYVAGHQSSQNLNVFKIEDGEGLDLEPDLPDPTIKVTGVTFCQGEAGKTVNATVTNAPTGYSIDWGNANITTGSSPTIGVVGTGLTTSTNLTAKLKDASGNVIKDKSGNEVKADRKSVV